MKWISNLILSCLFNFLLVILLLLSPLPFLFSSGKTKQILAKMDFYELITPIVRQRSIQFLGNQDFFSQILSANIDVIIQKSFIQNLTENIIDQCFLVIFNNKEFENIQIDISKVKNNFLAVLSQSELEKGKEQIKNQIPEKIRLSDLFSLNPHYLKNFGDNLKKIRQVLTYSVTAFIFLLVFISLIAILAKKKKEVFPFFSNNFLVSGFTVFLLGFFYQHILLDSVFLSQFLDSINSVFFKIILIVGLTFFQEITNIWLYLGFIISVIVITVKILKKIRYEKNINRKQ